MKIPRRQPVKTPAIWNDEARVWVELADHINDHGTWEKAEETAADNYARGRAVSKALDRYIAAYTLVGGIPQTLKGEQQE